MSIPYGGLDCSNVTPECPVEFSVLEYRPSLGANAFFLAIFALCAILQLIFGIKWKTWTFCFALTCGCILEFVGYIGRVLLWKNPYNTEGFEIQIICLIIAPAFTAAGVYLTLKHFVIAFGREYSLIKPQLYTWIFISADIFSLLLQALGAILSTVGASDITVGSDIALAGICFQVASLAFFGVTATVYFTRVWQNRSTVSDEAKKLAHSLRFRMFAGGIVLAYLTILTRCCYRIPELAGGWGNSVYRTEVLFIVLDGVMITMATLALTLLHPGFFFPRLSAPFRMRKKKERRAQSSESPESSGSDLEEAKVVEDSE
ncbi:hypothetical protein M409DRAFT_21972 [Zasmidium cellare ATCC 36951]|uniref:RTA1-domain-containing protein n=1 Tax=Zasmidium cellare ATCC 36951 TaxID=1080233 RepID=A0A6A6CL07_ZASCE|nr:uncharacterized protein M409DRAFT_21972 [Zasmidium cellare ATCC 36951]KAF2167825.1 hypothetical protein M409DRAFT_21972 [Zasmidium cellare ATCC 36951]